MKIALLAAGGPGEVQLFLALALGLRHLGHRTVLAAPEHAADEIGKYPVEYQPLPGCDEQRLQPPDYGPLARSEQYALHLALLLACRDCDAVISPPALLFEAGVISEWLRKPFMIVLPYPLLPATSAFPHMTVRAKPSSFRLFNRFSHHVFQRRHERRRMPDVNAWRAGRRSGRWRSSLSA
jgi:Glycosyltransferase family 28 N-terminal domain.